MFLRAIILAITSAALTALGHADASDNQLHRSASLVADVSSSQLASDPSQENLETIRQLIQAGRLEEAETSLRHGLSQQNDFAEGHYLLGFVLFREIQTNASREGDTQGSQYNDLNPSLAQFAKSHAEASLAEYTAGARGRKPTTADLKIVAFDYVILGDFANADKWLTRAVEWNPDDADGWYNLGRAKYNLNLFEQAIRCFERVLKLQPNNIKAKDNLGLSYEGLGKIDEAIAAYREALEWQQADKSGESFAGPNLDLGSLLLDQNKAQEALPYLVRAAQIAPRESRVHEKLGKAYSELNDLPKAQQELETAVQLSPGNSRLHFMLGQIYRKEGFVEKARGELDRSASLLGTHSQQ